MTRITLVHATPLAIAPVLESFEHIWPQAVLHSVLDDGLTADLARAPATIVPRFEALARYAQLAGSQAVLFTCSAFGEAIEAARRSVPLPMLKPNEAMFDEALGMGRRVVLLATFEPSIAPMLQEFEDAQRAQGVEAELLTVHVPGAFEALSAGRSEAHDRLITEAVAALPPHDAVMLAQFSMARAAQAAAQATKAPVLTSPDSAVRRLRAICAAASSHPFSFAPPSP